ncbi:type IV secretion system protein [Salmonella enterica subsp. diarizonae]|nr:type IV secretion system protein [Salmonella enterica subsp. diarizonae]EEP4215188.1 type IV secretion system protein [Salmonella enterica subsp. diarizonae]
MSLGMFETMYNFFDKGFNTVLQGLTSSFAQGVMILLTSSLTVLITYRGYQTLAGKLQRPVEDVVWDVTRILIIAAVVTNANGYLDSVFSAIDGFKNAFSGDKNIWASLDSAWEITQTVATGLSNQDDSMVPIRGGAAELIVWLGVGALMCATAFINIIADITLRLMTVTAPLFIFCLMYGFLKTMFENWAKTIFSVLLTILFSALALQIVMRFINLVLKAAENGAEDANIITLAIEIACACIGGIAIVWVSYMLANSLAGATTQAAMQGIAMSGMKNLLPKPKPSSNSNNTDRISTKRQSEISGSGADKMESPKARRAASIKTMQRINAQNK